MPDHAWLEELGRRISGARRRRGLLQNDVANELRVAPQTVSRWECGKHDVGVLMLSPIARLFEVSLDWLGQLTTHPSGLVPGTWVVDLDALQSTRPTASPDQQPPMWLVPANPAVVDAEGAHTIRSELLERASGRSID